MNLKRIISLILALVMVIGYVPSVFADESAPGVTVSRNALYVSLFTRDDPYGNRFVSYIGI